MSELNLPSVRRRYYPVKTKLSAVRDRVINEMGYAEVLAASSSIQVRGQTLDFSRLAPQV